MQEKRTDVQQRIAEIADQIRLLQAEFSSDPAPMMRPLFFSDNNPVLNTYCDSYLWGDAFLVSPVMISQTKNQEVYFPHLWQP